MYENDDDLTDDDDVFMKNENEEFESYFTDKDDEESVISLSSIEELDLKEENLNPLKLDSDSIANLIKPHEKELIDSCVDEELKHLMILNRTKKLYLLEVYKQLRAMMKECDACKFEIVQKNVTNTPTHSSPLWRLAAPYFKKGKDAFPAPSNPDVERKMKNNEITIYDLKQPLKWTDFELGKLTEGVNLVCNEIALNCSKSDKIKIPAPWKDEHLNWFKVSEMFFKMKRTERDCRLMWNNCAHPAINKSPWSKDENDRLKNIVESKYNFQNWKEITKDLATNRSAFTVCQHYFTKCHRAFNMGTFTFKEDRKLIELVDKYRNKNRIAWGLISSHFPTRSREQLYYRYKFYLGVKRKRGKFTSTEDVLLMVLVDRFGKNFTKIAEHMPGRSSTQLKSRYCINLERNIKSGIWTLQEDEEILKHIKKHGPRDWPILGKKLQRTNPQVRQRYYTIANFLKGDKKLTLKDVPRKKRSVPGQKHVQTLKSIASTFKNSKSIPTLREIRSLLSCLNIYGNKSETASSDNSNMSDDEHEHQDESTDQVDYTIYDNLLESYLMNNRFGQQKWMINDKDVIDCAEIMAKLMKDLKINLEIPSCLDDNLYLDNIDKKILSELSKRKEEHDTADVSFAIPPSFKTAICLKNLLQMSSDNIKLTAHTMKIKNSYKKWNISSELSKAQPSELQDLEQNLNLVYQRFKSLVMLPSAMLFNGPSEDLKKIVGGFTEFFNETEVIKTYSKKNPHAYKKIKLHHFDNSQSEKKSNSSDDTKMYLINQVEDNGKINVIIEEMKPEQPVPGTSKSTM